MRLATQLLCAGTKGDGPCRMTAGQLKPLAVIGWLLILAAAVGRAGTNDFVSQLITLPVNADASRFINLDNDQRSDLLAVDPAGNRLLIYRQRVSGFTNVPDQVIVLPPQTAWIAPCDVEAHPGLELLLSTATSLLYCRQNGGVFEPQPRLLVKVNQVFTNNDPPALALPLTNATIPVISATETVPFERDNAYAWTRGPPMALAVKRADWVFRRNQWTLGPNSSSTLRIRQSTRLRPDDTDPPQPENDAIRNLLETAKKTNPRQARREMVLDIDGDGRRDLVLWQVASGLEPKTDLFVFLRGADDKLPERPTQVLRCHGIPIPIGSSEEPSPVADLRGDGGRQLVMLELRATVVSASGVVEMVLSRGLDVNLTIRSFNHGAFSRSPDASVPLSVLLTGEDLMQWPVFIWGDFNGDGRADLLIQRSTSHWNVFFSTNDERWFVPQPAMTLETPVKGYFQITDLNGDSRSDIVLRADDDPRVFIYFTSAQLTKGKP